MNKIQQKKRKQSSELSLLLAKTTNLKSSLEEQWETSFSIYRKTQKVSIFSQNISFSYFCEIVVPSETNYLVLTQIIHLLSYNTRIQHVFRKLAKEEVQYRYREQLFFNKSSNKSLFVRLLLRLWIVEFTRYMKECTIYYRRQSYLLNFDNIAIQLCQDKLLCSSKDFLLLKLYLYRSQRWYIHPLNLFDKNNQDILVPLLDNYEENFTPSSLNYSLEWFRKQESIDKKNILFWKKYFKFRKNLRIISIQKYSDLLKHIIQYNKSLLQKYLITKINHIIRFSDRFLCTNSNKNEWAKLNSILFQYLYLWGMSRHSHHPAEWIKKRYLHHFQDGFYFSMF